VCSLLAALTTPWAVLALASLGLAVRPARVVLGGATGRALVPALAATGGYGLAYGALLGVGLALGR
jgi:1,4-dihydroxy-2-naphthoate octaprenyltransferase